MSAPLTSASAFRQVDALSGRAAELEVECDDWCRRCAEALRQRDAAIANGRYLSNELARVQAERDHARGELATARALRSVAP